VDDFIAERWNLSNGIIADRPPEELSLSLSATTSISVRLMNEPNESASEGAVPPRNSQRITIIVAVLTLLAVLLPSWSGFDAPGAPMDEGMLLVYPELILHGKLPYRDFETFYAPGNLLTLAGAYSVFGIRLDVERSVGLLYRLALAGGIFFVVRRLSLPAAVICTILGASFLLPTYLAAFAWLGGVSCALWSILLLAGPPGLRRAMAAGVLAGVALLYRVDLGPAVIASAIPLGLMLPPRLRWAYLGAATAALLPLAAVTFLAGPHATLENLFLYPVLIANPGRRLPLSAASDAIFFIFLLHVGACLCNLFAGGLACRRDRQSICARLFLAAALLAAALTPQTLQRVDETHLLVSAFLSIALFPMALVILGRRGAVQGAPAGWALGAAAAVAAVVSFKAPGLPVQFGRAVAQSLDHEAAPPPSVIVRGRQFPRPVFVPEAQQIASYLEAHSTPGERLFVGTADLRFTFYNDTFFYHLLPWLTPATYFLEMNPLSANRPNSRLANDVATADWLVLNRFWDQPSEPNQSRIPGSDAPNEVVRTQFVRLAIYDPFAIYRRRQPPEHTDKKPSIAP